MQLQKEHTYKPQKGHDSLSHMPRQLEHAGINAIGRLTMWRPWQSFWNAHVMRMSTRVVACSMKDPNWKILKKTLIRNGCAAICGRKHAFRINTRWVTHNTQRPSEKGWCRARCHNTVLLLFQIISACHCASKHVFCFLSVTRESIRNEANTS